MLLSCALWCRRQRAPLGKSLKMLILSDDGRTHNAGVEGSSPSLSTIYFQPLTHLRHQSKHGSRVNSV